MQVGSTAFHGDGLGAVAVLCCERLSSGAIRAVSIVLATAVSQAELVHTIFLGYVVVSIMG